MAEYGMVKSNKDIWYAIMHKEGHGPEGVIGDTQNEKQWPFGSITPGMLHKHSRMTCVWGMCIIPVSHIVTCKEEDKSQIQVDTADGTSILRTLES